MATEIVTIEHGKHRLRLVPELGGGIASWEWRSAQEWIPLLRPWDEASGDRYSLACFPLTPWSNRITQGGFEHDGVFHPIRANRIAEPFPIHGDGWLQRWHVADHGQDGIRMVLESDRFDGNPYRHVSTQDIRLLPNGLAIDLSVTHRGEGSLPYGLGLHPYFPRNRHTLLRSKATGVWLSGPDAIPVEHTDRLPPTWDFNEASSMEGTFIDNCFTGWDGESVISYPDRGLSIIMLMEDCNGYSLLYRPPEFDYFCLEPITHPIDAFHMPGRPGLVNLSQGETLTLRTRLLIA
jgi:aldose 1-epimerase